MIDSLGKLVSLRRSEVGVASLLFFYLFLMIGAFMMGQAVGSALFLAVFPRQLPSAMIGSAVAVGALVAVYIRLSSRLRLESIIIGALLVFALLFAGFWLLALLQLRWVYLLVYIFVYAVGAMGPMMGWTLANYVLTRVKRGGSSVSSEREQSLAAPSPALLLPTRCVKGGSHLRAC